MSKGWQDIDLLAGEEPVRNDPEPLPKPKLSNDAYYGLLGRITHFIMP
jgi:hypothetical protein